jgi:hypothetical protein
VLSPETAFLAASAKASPPKARPSMATSTLTARFIWPAIVYTGEWRVEYFDDDGGCYITIFAGPAAERRACDYFNSLKSGLLSIQRQPAPQ